MKFLFVVCWSSYESYYTLLPQLVCLFAFKISSNNDDFAQWWKPFYTLKIMVLARCQPFWLQKDKDDNSHKCYYQTNNTFGIRYCTFKRNLPDGFLNRLSFWDPQKGHFGRVSIHFAILGRRETLAASSTSFGNFSST